MKNIMQIFFLNNNSRFFLYLRRIIILKRFKIPMFALNYTAATNCAMFCSRAKLKCLLTPCLVSASSAEHFEDLRLPYFDLQSLFQEQFPPTNVSLQETHHS
jgi:hypothetical protein